MKNKNTKQLLLVKTKRGNLKRDHGCGFFSHTAILMVFATSLASAQQPPSPQQADGKTQATPAEAADPVAKESPVTLQPLTILGRVPSLTTITQDVAASPANITIINKKELDRLTINTYGDILRNRAGINVIEYNQGLVAYGITMRGFQEGHGSNVAAYLDGMPLNITGSQHTNGYGDQAQIIPELVDRVEITRGPFSVLAGNHAVGGSLQLTTAENIRSSFRYQVDHFGRSRILPIFSFDLGPGHLVSALDITKGGGYTEQSNLNRVNFFSRYSMPLGDGVASVRIQSYVADAQATGYLDRAKLMSGEIDKHSALNRGIGDAKTQQNIVLNYRSNDLEGASGIGSGWYASIYYNRDIRRRWTNFDLSLPVNSTEPLNGERDRLHQVGFDIRKTTSFNVLSIPSQLVAGFQLNNEEIHAMRRRTDSAHNLLAPSIGTPDVIDVQRNVETFTRAFYANYQFQPISRLKLMAGLRYDWIDFYNRLNPDDNAYAAAVANGLPTNLNRSAQQFSPKLGAALSVYEDKNYRAELYGNIARGLKSPYAFSDFYASVTGATPSLAGNLSITSLWSFEYGLKLGSTDGRYNFRIGFWNTHQDRESSRNAAGFQQNLFKTNRDGFDVEGEWKILPETRIFANYSQVKARIEEPATPGAVYIPQVPRNITSFGVESAFNIRGHPIVLTLADSYVGRMPISTDNTLETRSYHRYMLRAAYTLPKSWRHTVISANVVGYSKQFEEVALDFGGGLAGVAVSPRVRATFVIQVPL
jgi:outer membrane receptor protein involved in Fe transport